MSTMSFFRLSRYRWSKRIEPWASPPESFSVIEGTNSKPVGYFSALVHEVRNPLCNINLACGMLHLSSLDEEQRECLQIIMRGSERINDLIDNVLRFDGINSAKYDLYSLQELLEGVLTASKDRISRKQVEVSREYAATDDIISMDIEKMEIALINIITNAIDSMPPKRGKLNVVTRSAGKLSLVEIQDNGIGISKENLNRLFEPYYTTKPGGMGVGLSATLNILRANHAGIEVRSEEGIGTCFIISFVRS